MMLIVVAALNLLARVASIVLGVISIAQRINWLSVFGVLGIVFGVSVTHELAAFRVELQEFRGSVVYDIDKVRIKMAEEMSYMYYQGCREGTEYPDAFRVAVGFNANSPMSWCTDKRDKEWMEYIYIETSKVGKKDTR